MPLPSPNQVYQTITVYYDTGNALVGTYDNANQTINNSNTPIEIVSNSGQFVAAISSVLPGSSLYTNIGAASLTLIKMGENAQNAADSGQSYEIPIGDLLSLAGNAAAVIGSVLLISGAAPVVVLGFTVAGFAFGLEGFFLNERAANSTGDSFSKSPVANAVATTFTASTRYTQPRRDPLTFDLDGDGLETVGTAAGILFDHNADGVKTGTGWVKADDALLVRDLNGNGTIDNGRELFGDATMKSNGQLAADGFDALADLDSNLDGQITSADSAYSSLRLWRDLNQDGISQSGELFTLDDLGIASINVASTEHSKLLSNGNQVADLGTYTKTDGTTGSTGEVSGDLGDINLATDTFHRSFTDTLDTTAVATLPDMQGSGAVRDLKQAASQSAALAATLASLGPNTTRDQLKAAIPTVLQQWADGAAFTDSFEAAAADGKDLFFVPPGVSVLDAYNARYAVTTKYTSINGTQGTVALTEADQDRYAVIRAQMDSIERLVKTLEAFNGRNFAPIAGASSTVATFGTAGAPTGSVSFGAGNPPVIYGMEQARLNLLNQSYAALTESVYGALVTQTRLKPYLDAITLSVDANGVTLCAASIAANDSAWRKLA